MHSGIIWTLTLPKRIWLIGTRSLRSEFLRDVSKKHMEGISEHFILNIFDIH